MAISLFWYKNHIPNRTMGKQGSEKLASGGETDEYEALGTLHC